MGAGRLAGSFEGCKDANRLPVTICFFLSGAAALILQVLDDRPLGCDGGRPPREGSVGQTLAFETRYEYLGTEDQGGKTLDKISLKATGVSYLIDPNSTTPIRVKESALTIGASEGTIYFDREKGAVVQTINKTTVQGTLTLVADSIELPGKLDLKIEEKITLQP